jgi:sarcosine oxidase
MQLPLQVTRQVLYWFAPVSQPELFRESNFPIYIMEGQPGQPLLYGFPFTSPAYDSLKVGLHGSTEICTPETVVRTIRAQDEQTIRTRLADALPLLAGRLLRAETCLYTMTPDEHFLIDKHPRLSQVTLAAGFSGHGFKFASGIGEILANLATDQPTGYDLDLFSLSRFVSKINRDTNTQSAPQGVT